MAVALQFLPMLLFGLFGGVVADRFPKRTILIITQSTWRASAATLGVLALTGAVQAWHVYVLAFVLGLVTVVDNPTRQVFVSELVGQAHIRNAVSLNSSVFQLGALLGPAVSGALIHAVGQGWSFLINVASCLLVVTIVAVIRLPTKTGRRPVRAAGGSCARRCSYIGRRPRWPGPSCWPAPSACFGLNMPVILAAFAEHEFSTGVTRLQPVQLAHRDRRPDRSDPVGPPDRGAAALRMLVSVLSGLGVILILAAFAPTIWLFGAMLVGSGLLTLLFLTGANSLVQTTLGLGRSRTGDERLHLVLLGGQAIGGPAVGWLIDHFGARASMFLCGGLVTLMALLTGVAIARQAHLGLEMDLHREQGGSPLHIVQH